MSPCSLVKARRVDASLIIVSNLSNRAHTSKRTLIVIIRLRLVPNRLLVSGVSCLFLAPGLEIRMPDHLLLQWIASTCSRLYVCLRTWWRKSHLNIWPTRRTQLVHLHFLYRGSRDWARMHSSWISQATRREYATRPLATAYYPRVALTRTILLIQSE